eukprot:122356-Chlamydomonas_euryale.AAC.2
MLPPSSTGALGMACARPRNHGGGGVACGVASSATSPLHGLPHGLLHTCSGSGEGLANAEWARGLLLPRMSAGGRPSCRRTPWRATTPLKSVMRQPV